MLNEKLNKGLLLVLSSFFIIVLSSCDSKPDSSNSTDPADDQAAEEVAEDLEDLTGKADSALSKAAAQRGRALGTSFAQAGAIASGNNAGSQGGGGNTADAADASDASDPSPSPPADERAGGTWADTSGSTGPSDVNPFTRGACLAEYNELQQKNSESKELLARYKQYQVNITDQVTRQRNIVAELEAAGGAINPALRQAREQLQTLETQRTEKIELSRQMSSANSALEAALESYQDCLSSAS